MRQLKISKSITNRDSHALEKYLQDIGKVPLVTADEEVALAKRIKQGDDLALEKLVTANLRFVVSVAKQYQNRSLTLNDLINEGNLGLVKAAQRFDHTKGFKFISYAVWWIRQSIIQSLAEQSRMVRLPLNKIGSLTKIQQAFSELEQEHEREPTAEELSEIVSMSAEDIRITMGIASNHMSVDAPFKDEDGNSLLDVLENKEFRRADEQMTHNDSLKIECERTLGTLTDRQREVVKLFYGIGVDSPMTLEDIGDNFGLTRERVRQIKDKAINKLRATPRSRALRTFLGQ